MENPTSFDLNRAIETWRRKLAQSPAFRSENLDELESHLRDSTVVLQTRGLSPEEAFDVAAKRVGGQTTLEKEYAKINGDLIWAQRGLWMLIGILAWQLAYGFINLLSQNAAFYSMQGLGFHFASGKVALPVTVFCAASLVGLIGSVWLGWWLCGRPSESVNVWFSKVSQSAGASFVVFVIMCVGLLSTYGIGMLLEILRVRYVSPADLGQFAVSRYYAGLIMVVVQTATLSALTLFLIHKRMRTSNA
jgi:hypothetical protein